MQVDISTIAEKENNVDLGIDLEWCRQTQFCKWGRAGKGRIPMSVAEMDFRPHPGIGKALSHYILADQTAYIPPLGHPDVREAIAKFQSKRYNIDLELDHIVCSGGVRQTISYLLRTFLKEQDQILFIGSPIYSAIHNIIINIGCSWSVLPYDALCKNTINETALSLVEGQVRVVIVTSPHNPTGRLLSLEEKESIAKYAEAHNAIIISDEVYEHLFEPATCSSISLTNKYTEMNTLSISGFGKSFNIGGYRTAFVTHRGDKINNVMQKWGENVFSCSSLSQYAALACTVVADDWLPIIIAELIKNQDTVALELKKSDRIIVPPAGNGMFAWFGVNCDIDLSSVCSAASIDVMGGEAFFFGDKRWVRMNIATSNELVSSACRSIVKRLT